jgi:hypothetical protein
MPVRLLTRLDSPKLCQAELMVLSVYTYVVSHYNDPIFILQEAVW